MPLPLQAAFVAGSPGIWRIERITAVAGESLPPAERLAVIERPEAQRPLEGSWILRGASLPWPPNVHFRSEGDTRLYSGDVRS